DVADLVNSVALTAKTSAECEQHYTEVYLNSRTSPLPDTSALLMGRDGGPLKLAEMEEAQKERGTQETSKTGEEEKKEGENAEHDEDDASRPAGGVAPPSRAGTAKPTHSIVGYWPLRGDFDVEYDNDAELILADMEFKEDEAVQERYLKLQIIEIYNSKLDERLYRKRTVINRGLLDTKTLHQREKKRTKEERDLHNLFKPLARFHSDEEQERLVQLLIEEKRIRARLSMLHEWKSLGLKTADDVGEYEGDKSWREQLQRFRASELSSLFFSGGLANLFAKHATAQQTGRPLPHAASGAKLCMSPSAAGCTYAAPETPSPGPTGGAGDTPTHSNASSPSAGSGASLSMPVSVVEKGNGEKALEKGKREAKEKADDKGRFFKGGRSSPGDKEDETLPITAFPGAGLLTEKERAFCEDAQLAPVFYLLAKRMLLREMAKHKKFNATDFSKPMELYVNRVGQLYDFYVNVSDFAPAGVSPNNTVSSRGPALAISGNAASVVSPRPPVSPPAMGSSVGGAAPVTAAFYRTVAGATPGIEPVYNTVNGGVALQPSSGYAHPAVSAKHDAGTGPLCGSPHGRTNQGDLGLLTEARDAC
ncbi:ADA2-A transcriptional co-activator SAGA component, partial [Toxoplasma gondii RUB]